SAGAPHLSPAQQQHLLGQLVKYAQCMRAHGLPNFADPHTDNGGGRPGGGSPQRSPQPTPPRQSRPPPLPHRGGGKVEGAGGRGDAGAAAGRGVPAGPDPGRGGGRRRRVVLAGAAAVVAAAGVTVAVAGPFGGTGHAGGGAAASGYPTSLSAIARRLLQAQTSVSATLGYAGSYTVTGHGGTLTWLPAAGRVVAQP